jgi:hypothetical protein
MDRSPHRARRGRRPAPLRTALGGDLVEASAEAVERRLLAGKILPAPHGDIDISRRDLDADRDPADDLRGNDCRAAPEKRIVDRLTRPGIILDRPAHAFDRLLRYSGANGTSGFYSLTRHSISCPPMIAGKASIPTPRIGRRLLISSTEND